MNLRKHLAGLAIFSAILGTAIFINHYLTLPTPAIPPVPVTPPVVKQNEGAQFINFKVRQVSLDFVNRASYTALTLKLLPGRSAPDKLWVTTFYFSPDIQGGGWSNTTEVNWPFALGNQVEVVTSDPQEFSIPPGASYFARVYVSAGSPDKPYDESLRFDRSLTDAIPVVVQWPEAKRQPSEPAGEVVRGRYIIR